VSIPVYTTPIMRSREPNRFDRDAPRSALRILVDAPLWIGDVDGEGIYHGYPFVGSGSTGHPDAAAVFRSYLRSNAFEVFHVSDELGVMGAVVLDEPEDGCDDLGFAIQYPAGVGVRGVGYYQDQMTEASSLAATLGLPVPETRAGVLLASLGNELEADIIVTDRAWLLDQRQEQRRQRALTSVMSVVEALALMGLYLRWHNEPIIIGGQPVRWGSAAMHRAAAFAALPSFERWNHAARRTCDATGDDALHTLSQTFLTRVARAFKFRDNVYGLSATMKDHEPEEMLCELDSFLYSLVGAFDVAAVFTDRALALTSTSPSIGWQKGAWHAKLKTPAVALHDHTDTTADMATVFGILRWLRNTVHDEALDLIVESGRYLVTMPDGTEARLRELCRSGAMGWDQRSLGIHPLPVPGAVSSKWLPGVGRNTVRVMRSGAPSHPDPLSGELGLDVRTFLNRIFPAALAALDQVMALTPLTQIPGYATVWENPS
jgi:hypothetical protein